MSKRLKFHANVAGYSYGEEALVIDDERAQRFIDGGWAVEVGPVKKSRAKPIEAPVAEEPTPEPPVIPDPVVETPLEPEDEPMEIVGG